MFALIMILALAVIGIMVLIVQMERRVNILERELVKPTNLDATPPDDANEHRESYRAKVVEGKWEQ